MGQKVRYFQSKMSIAYRFRVWSAGLWSRVASEEPAASVFREDGDNKSETSVTPYNATQWNTLENHILNHHGLEHLKYHIQNLKLRYLKRWNYSRACYKGQIQWRDKPVWLSRCFHCEVFPLLTKKSDEIPRMADQMYVTFLLSLISIENGVKYPSNGRDSNLRSECFSF
jgi:hypothetical protein